MTTYKIKEIKPSVKHYDQETRRLEYLAKLITAVENLPDTSYLTLREAAMLEQLESKIEDFRLKTIKSGIQENIPYEHLARNYKKSMSWFSKLKQQFGLQAKGQDFESRVYAERIIQSKHDN